MEPVKHHHHFRKDLLERSDRVAMCERYVVDLLLNTSLPDSQRESSVAWELKHHSGVTQMARLLARKRGLPLDQCTVGSLLHDIYVIVEGKYKDHAHLGAPIAANILTEVGGFNSDEADQVFRIVYYHSDKDDWSDDPFKEFGKDADILDIFLYPGPYGEYLTIKSIPVFAHYLKRAKRIWTELGLPSDPRYDLLENYKPSWFDRLFVISSEEMTTLLASLFHLTSLPKQEGLCPPSFCLVPGNVLVSSPSPRGFDGSQTTWEFHGNRDSWHGYIESAREIDSGESSRRFFDGLGRMIADQSDTIIETRLVFAEATSQDHLKAKDLLERSQNNASAIVLWPLADLFEVIGVPSDSARLRELGVPQYRSAQ